MGFQSKGVSQQQAEEEECGRDGEQRGRGGKATIPGRGWWLERSPERVKDSVTRAGAGFEVVLSQLVLRAFYTSSFEGPIDSYPPLPVWIPNRPLTTKA